MIDYSVVIPAYNEEHTIERAIQETERVLSSLSNNYEIIIVDDGSQDKTAENVKKRSSKFPHIQLISLTSNQGKGTAVKTGILATQGAYVGFLDADLATHPQELIKGFDLLKTYDLAIASRRMSGAHIKKPQTWYCSLAGQAFNMILRSYLDLPYFDTQCGCKVFRQDIAQILFQNLKTHGWSFDAELVYTAKKRGYSIAEFPVEWKNGPSTRVHWQDAKAILKELQGIKRNGS